MSPIDFTKLGDVAVKEAEELEGRVYRRVAKATNAFGGRLMMSENDQVCEAIEVLLGIKPGGNEVAAELLGMNGNTAPTGPAELTAAPADVDRNKVLPLYNADGSHQGTGLPMDKALELGFVAKLDGEGKIEGYILPATSPVPASATSLDKVVNVKDKKGTNIRQIKVGDGMSDNLLKPMLAGDGTVDHFVTLSRVFKR